MKIGILTFHNAHNYGAVLQAYALKEYLKQSGHEVHIINYRNPILKKRYAKRLVMPEALVPLRSLVHPGVLKRYLRSIPKAGYAQEKWSVQWTKFEEFIREVLQEHQTEEIMYEELGELDYDAFVTGSDQVWECGITGGIPDDAYFLNFPTSAKRIAYAASMRSAEIPEKFRQYYAKSLGRMEAVSVREHDIAEALAKVSGKRIETVLDPSLLLDAEDYRGLESVIEEQEDAYVFAYFVAEDPGMMACAQRIAEGLKLPLVELHYYALKELEGHDARADMGPGEFLSYVDHAAFVITNSFHGTVFSILFHKRFYSYYVEDARKENLLMSLGLSDRNIHQPEQVDLQEQIDYEAVGGRLCAARQISYEFMEKAFG